MLTFRSSVYKLIVTALWWKLSFCLTIIAPKSTKFGLLQNTALYSSSQYETTSCEKIHAQVPKVQETEKPGVLSRRNVFASIQQKAVISGIGSSLWMSSNCRPAFAKENTDEASLVSTAELTQRLREVPTFTLVDKLGAPYAVVGEDAKLSTYFFTSYDEAKRILLSAKKSFEKTKVSGIREANEKRAKKKLPPLTPEQVEDEFGKNPWNYARISSVALDLAVSLAIKASGKRTGAYFFVQSPEADVQDALTLSKDGRDELAEGKVPLFYMENLKLSGTETPVYFNKSQLIKEWKKQNPKTNENEMPEILISELYSLITEMVQPGGKDEELKTIVFIPPENSKQKALECNKVKDGAVPFKLGERIIVL